MFQRNNFEISVDFKWITQHHIPQNIGFFLTTAVTSNPTIQAFVGREVLTAVVRKNPIFCDITSCSLVKVNRRFGGICGPLKSKPNMKHLCLLSASG
jgi:hypothetical protein